MVVATGGLVMAWMWLKRFGSNLVVAKRGLVVAKGGLEVGWQWPGGGLVVAWQWPKCAWE